MFRRMVDYRGSPVLRALALSPEEPMGSKRREETVQKWFESESLRVSLCYDNPSMFPITFPFCLNRASFKAALNNPLGLHENFIPSGT